MKTLFKQILLLLEFIIIPHFLFAQATEPFTITGNVYSVVDSLPIEGIKVVFLFQPDTTDNKGFFKFNGFIEEYGNEKIRFRFKDNGQARKQKYKTKDTLIDIYSRHLNIYLEELKPN